MLKNIWLQLSGFGIMFAILSWLQEAKLIPDAEVLGAYKGVIAIGTGLMLYFFVARNME